MTITHGSPLNGGSADAIAIMLEEYRQMYGLALFRLQALEQRVPVIGAVLAAVLGIIGSLQPPLQGMLLVGLPISLLWFSRTTVNHARSFEDALRRIEEIERTINAVAGKPLLEFQSSHPSRGRWIGGRTGTETTEAVSAASAVLLAGCLHSVFSVLAVGRLEQGVYAIFVAVAAGLLLVIRRGLDSYRYAPRSENLDAGHR